MTRRRLIRGGLVGGPFLAIAVVAAVITFPFHASPHEVSPRSASAPGVATSPAPSAPDSGTVAGPSSQAARSLRAGVVASGSSATAAALIVPVADFRSPTVSIGLADVHAALDGSGASFARLELVAADADGILGSLGLTPATRSGSLVLAADAGQLATDLSAHHERLGFLRADQVQPDVRALGWGGKELFGVHRVRTLADWPLVARLPASASSASFDPRKTWTLVAGGDILLDRGVAKQVKILGKGVDFPFDGGRAEISGRYCCSSFGWQLPVTRRTGGAGAVRDLLRSADIAVANFENPAPDAFRYHVKGTVFSADPRLIDGLVHAGIDVVSLGNNHIRDAGGQGVIDTVRNLDERGILHSGAGRNLTAARRPALIDFAGIKVAFLGYDTVAKSYAAGPDRAGSAQLTPSVVAADVKGARKAGADLVIVYPHWGTEYKASPFAAERALAHAVIDAGADLVIGNHAHWVGAMELYKGRPIWYALGNFVFDQTWSEPTMEGLILELTFSGRHLVQVRLHPTVILDQAQPNLLDPAGSGRVVLGQLYDASKGLLPW